MDCTKQVLSTNGFIEKRTSELTARKYPLHEIRKKSLVKNSNFLKIVTDESYNNMSEEDAMARLTELNETVCRNKGAAEQLKCIEQNRNWLIWHDYSGIENRGLMLFLLRELYDPAIHMTSTEFKKKNGLDINVQSVIEEPKLYMMGFSGSSDADQLMCVATTRECLQCLSHPIEIHGATINDTMRFMNGANPSNEFLDGTQKGGTVGVLGAMVI
jgi:hypothetical protein